MSVAMNLPAEAWWEGTWREGTKGPLRRRFAALQVQPSRDHVQGKVNEPGQWLLTEWPLDEPRPTKLWLSNPPEDTSLHELVYWAKIRWWGGQNCQQLKEEVGLDHFEGRSWIGWHHHVTLAMIAFDFLVLEGLRSKKASGWTLPRVRRELQRVLMARLGFCPMYPQRMVFDANLLWRRGFGLERTPPPVRIRDGA